MDTLKVKNIYLLKNQAHMNNKTIKKIRQWLSVGNGSRNP
jgi:hypothetical protein